MEFTTKFELQSQATRLVESMCQGTKFPGKKGSFTLPAALFQETWPGNSTNNTSPDQFVFLPKLRPAIFTQSNHMFKSTTNEPMTRELTTSKPMTRKLDRATASESKHSLCVPYPKQK